MCDSRIQNRAVITRALSGACPSLLCLFALCASAAPPSEPVIPVARPSAVVWAGALDGGSIKVLFIAPVSRFGDADELARCLDIELDAVPLSVEPDSPDSLTHESLELLRKRLGKRHDVIIAAGLSLSLLPDDAVTELIAAVRGGTGLVLAHYREGMPSAFAAFMESLAPVESVEAITRGTGHAMTPEWAGGVDFVHVSTSERGRVVELNYPGACPLSHCLLPELLSPGDAQWEHLDAYLSLIAKAVRWVAGREPSVWVSRIEAQEPPSPDADLLPPGMTEQDIRAERAAVRGSNYRTFIVRLNGPAQKSYRVRAQLRPVGGSWIVQTEFNPLDKGAESCYVQMAAIPGKSYLDVWLLDGDHVVEWHTEPVAIEARPDFQDLVFTPGVLMPNDTLAAQMNIRPSRRTEDGVRQCVAAMRATDPLGRVVARSFERIQGEGGPASTSIELVDLLADSLKVELFVFSEDPRKKQFSDADLWLTSSARAAVFLPVQFPARVEQFGLNVAVRNPWEYGVRMLYPGLAAAGVSSIRAEAGRDFAFYVSQAGLRPVMRFDSSWDVAFVERYIVETAATRPGQAEWDSEMRRIVRELALAGPRVHLLGGDSAAVDTRRMIEESQASKALFVDGLRARFTDIAQLNAAWGTRFDTWDVVERESAAPADMALWLGYQTHVDSLLLDICRDARDAMRAESPEVSVGILSGMPDSANPSPDWPRLAEALDLMVVPAAPVAVEKVRSSLAMNSRAGLVPLVGLDSRRARWLPWHAAMHGFSGVWWGEALGGSSADELEPATTPDGAPSPTLVAAAESVATIREGLGDVLNRAERVPARIAVYENRANTLLSHAMGRTEAEARVVRSLQWLGYQFDFVSSRQIARGGLKDYALLLLPGVLAMSDADIVAVREFHAAGGSVIADVRPARFDEQGVERQSLPMDDLFGVVASPEAQAGGSARDLAVGLNLGEKAVEGRIPGVVLDASVQSAGADAMGLADGEHAAWFLRKAGQGFTGLLNHPIPDPAGPGGEDLPRLFSGFLEHAGVRPVVDFSDGKRRFCPGEWVQYRYGKSDIFAMLTDPDSKQTKLSFGLGDQGRVHDMLGGRTSLRPKRISCKLVPGEPVFYCRTPYEVSDLVIIAPEAVAAGRRLQVGARVVAKDGTPGEHMVHVALQTLSDQPVPQASVNVVCKSGVGESFIPLACSQAPGTYKLVARDMLTGFTRQEIVKILPEDPMTIVDSRAQW